MKARTLHFTATITTPKERLREFVAAQRAMPDKGLRLGMAAYERLADDIEAFVTEREIREAAASESTREELAARDAVLTSGRLAVSRGDIERLDAYRDLVLARATLPRPRAEVTEAMARDKRLRFELDHALRDFDALSGDDVQPEDRDALVMVRMETRTALRLRSALAASTGGGK